MSGKCSLEWDHKKRETGQSGSENAEWMMIYDAVSYKTSCWSRHSAEEWPDVPGFNRLCERTFMLWCLSWDILLNQVGVRSVQSCFCWHFLLFNNLQQGLDLSQTSVFKNTLHRLFACFWHVGDMRPPSEQRWPVVQTQLKFHPFRGSRRDKNLENKVSQRSPACLAALTELMKLFKCGTILHCPSRFLWYY